MSIVSRAFEVFRTDAEAPPPLTLRGGNAIDGYEQPPPYDPGQDEPTDAYLEGFTFWGLGYLDARSWRHYLPTLIDYAFRKPDDPAMVIEGLVRSFRPPDRYPPRLGTLTAGQEDVVRAFLEQAALGDTFPHVQAEAQQALEEWWLPNPRCRPTAEETAALRTAPVTHRFVGGALYRLAVPDTFTAVNGTPLEVRSLDESIRSRVTLFRNPAPPRSVAVPGSPRAERLDGLTHGHSPAEPQTLALVFAIAGTELVTLSIRSWPRDDLDREVERMIGSFEILQV